MESPVQNVAAPAEFRCGSSPPPHRKPMKVLLAAFDQAHPGPAGNYWAWAHPDLPAAMRDEFYFTVAAKHFDSLPQTIPLDSLIGGGAALTADWCCWYRFIDGGYDMQGRPGRVVVLCGFADRQASASADLSGLLRSPIFTNLASVAHNQCPLEAPPSLAIEPDWPQERQATKDPPYLPIGERAQWQGPGAISKAMHAASLLPPDQRWQCEVNSAPGSETSTLWRLAPTLPKPPDVESPDTTPPPQNPTASPTRSTSTLSTPSPVATPLDPSHNAPASSPRHRFRRGFSLGVLVGLLIGFALGWLIEWEYGNFEGFLEFLSRITSKHWLHWR